MAQVAIIFFADALIGAQRPQGVDGRPDESPDTSAALRLNGECAAGLREQLTELMEDALAGLGTVYANASRLPHGFPRTSG